MKRSISLHTIRLAIVRRRLASLLLAVVMVVVGGVCAALGGLLIEQEEALERTIRDTQIVCIGTSPSGRANEIEVVSAYLDMLTGRRHWDGCYLDRRVKNVCALTSVPLPEPQDTQLRLIYSLASDPALQGAGVTVTMEEGWSETCLAGEERVCIITEALAGQVREKDGKQLLTITHSILGEEKTEELQVVGRVSGLGAKTVYCPYYIRLADRVQTMYKLDTMSFLIRDNTQLEETKEELYRYFMVPDRNLLQGSPTAAGLLVEDEAYQRALAELRGNVQLLKLLLPGLAVAAAALVCLIGCLTNRRRLREFAVLRCMGQKKGEIFTQVLMEQGFLTAGGGLAGLAIGSLLTAPTLAGALAAGGCILAGLLGGALCALWICRADPMALMKAEE